MEQGIVQGRIQRIRLIPSVEFMEGKFGYLVPVFDA